MIPIRDDCPRRYPCLATWSIIAINVLVFFFGISLPQETLEHLTQTFGFVPARLTHSMTYLAAAVPLLTSMFLHGGLLHVLGNMWTLWIFGDNVEDRMGPVRFVSFYLLCGLVAGLAHWLINPESTVPTVGASGAVSAVMGAYLVLFPRARIILFFPILFLPYFFQLPAWTYLGLWFLGQGVGGIETVGQADIGGIAFWAHITGFIAGIVLHRFFLRPKGTYRQPQPDEMQPRTAWARAR